MEKYLLPTESLNDFCDIAYKVFYGYKAEYEPNFPVYANEKSFFYNRCFLDNTKLADVTKRLESLLKSPAGFRTHITYTVETVPINVDYYFTNEARFDLVCHQYGVILVLSKDFSEGIENANKDENIIKIEHDDSKDWTNALVAGFGEEKIPEFYLYHYLAEREDVFMYAYYMDNKIVGTALLYINPENKENAGVHEVSVLPEYRRKGIADKLIYKTINDAQKAGIKYLSLQASETGSKVYEKIGFKHVSQFKTWLG